MRNHREPNIFEEKHFLSEDESVRTQGACLNRIYRRVDMEGLSAAAREDLRDDIKYIGEVFHLDDDSVILLAGILEKASVCNMVDDEDLARFLGCTNIEFLRYHDNLDRMDKVGVITIFNGPRNRCFRVTPETLKAVEKNGEFKPVPMNGLTGEELFLRFRKLFGLFRSDSMDSDRLIEELDYLVRNNDHLPFCRRALDSALYSLCDDTDRRMFYYICHRYVSHGNRSVSLDILSNYLGFMEDDEAFKRRVARESTNLQKYGLAGFAIEDGFVDTDSLALSDSVRAMYFNEIEIVPEETVKHRDIIGADTITPKELFFNPAEQAQVSRLEGLLGEANFRDVQQRLQSCGMRRGFNILFYGAPGTGKTASAYELARTTGRDLFRVDMSKLKSKWVGESEKSVRGLFKLYRKMCHTGAKAPILLFNEADAIFSRRLENVERSVDQMNNAIQNIILEEMENIDGILIATTNLITNLDPAFERRFIFKVEFKTPEKESRARIWQSMIPNLSAEDAATLADRYCFAGGHIENIARKSTVEYVLSGDEPTLSSLDGYCREELLNRRNTRKIGF